MVFKLSCKYKFFYRLFLQSPTGSGNEAIAFIGQKVSAEKFPRVLHE